MEFITKKLSQNDIFQVLKNRSFLLLMISEFFSQISFNMQHFVFIFVVYGLTHSNTAVSGIILSFTIPAILFSLIAGVYVDRWNKRYVLLIANILRGILLLFFLIPNLSLINIYILTFLIAAVTQFFLPAESAIIPLLVRPKQLVSGNAVFVIGVYSTVLIGYVLSGPILLLLGKNSTFLFMAMLFFISAICIPLIRFPEKIIGERLLPERSLITSFSLEITEVFQFIRKVRKITQALLILVLSQAIIFTFAVLGPGYVSDILRVQVESLSIILLAPAATGMILGAIILGSLGKKIRGKNLVSAGFFITGMIFLFLPFGSKVASRDFVQTVNIFLPPFLDVTIVHIITLLAFLAGVANSFVFVPANVTIQRESNAQIRGRVYGLLNAIVAAASLLPVALAGGLADLLGMVTVLIGIGILMLVFSVLFLFLH